MVLISSLILTESGCKKTEDIYLNELPPQGQLDLISLDSFGLDLFTAPRRNSYGKYLTYQVLGSYIDPVFGSSDASFYTQIASPTQLPDISGQNIVDSVVLIIRARPDLGQIGDAKVPVNYKIYQVNETLNTSNSVFYASDSVLSRGKLYGEGTTTYNKDSLIRIKLNDQLGYDLFVNQSWLYSSSLLNESFKGLFIQSNSIGQSAAQFQIDPVSSQSGINIYYHSDKVTSAILIMKMDQGTFKLQNYNNDAIGSDLGNQLNNPIIRYPEVLINNGGSTQVRLIIPGLKEFAKMGNVAINRAELKLPVVTMSNGKSSAYNTRNIFIRPSNSMGYDSIVPDYDEYSGDYFRQSLSKNNSEYNVVLTRYIQYTLAQYRLQGDSYVQYGLNITVPPDNPPGPQGAILTTQIYNVNNLRPKLTLTYSKTN